MTSLAKAPVGESVLSLTGVAKRFGAVQALTDVHLHVGAGEVVALVGDNGAGKSTLVKIIAGVYQNDAGTISLSGKEVKVGGPSQAQALGIATVFQDLALCDNLDVVANLFLGQERTQGAVLDEVQMEKESWRLLRTLSAKIPSVRIPIASLSGGQRQTVAIARSLVGKPKVVMLDEPTAALGVAQTAEVLNLIERLRETGLGVILVSHNMADVQAVADRIVVFASAGTPPSSGWRTCRPPSWWLRSPERQTTWSRSEPPRTRTEVMAEPVSPIAADLLDERLIKTQGFVGYAKQEWNRLRLGELGSVPVVFGLVIISIVFYSAEPIFLSSRNLVSIMQFAAPIGVISLGIVLVLLLGEIDLSVGSVSGLAAASMTVLVVRHEQSMALGLLVGIGVGVAVGFFYALLYTRVGVPSFVFSLAGLLGFQGLLLYVLGKEGTLNLPGNSWLIDFARFQFLPVGVSYALVVLIALLFLGGQLWTYRTRQQAGLSTPWVPLIIAKTVALAAGLGYLTYYLNIDRGWGYLWVFFAILVVVMDFALRRTTWGRHLFAVGGNEEASRRSGIKVDRVYLSAFVLCSTLRCARRHSRRGAGDLGLAGQRHDRHQPDRDRRRRDRWHQPVRWAWVCVLGHARDPGPPGDPVRAEPDRRRLVRSVHGDRRGAAARSRHRLRFAQGKSQQRTGLTTGSWSYHHFAGGLRGLGGAAAPRA